MLRKVLSVTLLSSFVCLACAATTVLAAESKDQSSKNGQCSKSECAASCEKATCKVAACSADSSDDASATVAVCSATKSCSKGVCDSNSCADTKCSTDTCSTKTCSTKKCSASACSGKACSAADDTLVTVTESSVNAQCAADACCESEASKTACCETAKKPVCCTTEKVAELVDVVSDCPCASVTAGTTGCDTKCECGSECKCAKTASAHVAAIHKRLVDENVKVAELTAQIELHGQLAQAREEFNKRMLAKEVELVHLQAQLSLADERIALNQKVAAAAAENAQLKASLRVVQGQTETLQHQIAQRPHAVGAALADYKAGNAKLKQRIVELEQQLEMLSIRLAKQPTDEQVQ